MAEACHPGITALYNQLEDKPATFLQLLWAYEGMLERAGAGLSAVNSQA